MNDMHKAKQTLHKGTDQAEGILDEAQSRVSDLVDDVKDKGEELLQEVKERGLKLFDKGQERGEEAWKDVATLVRKYPGRSLGIAFLAGAVTFAYFIRQDD